MAPETDSSFGASLDFSGFYSTNSLSSINHGTLSPVKRIADSTPEEWRSLFDVNFFSAIAFVSVVYPTAYDILKDYEIKSAIPQLRKSHGKIVITSSGAATGAYSTWGPYGASKAALNHLAMTLSVEEPDITTVSIRPGVVDTQMQSEVRGYNKVMDPQDAEKFKSLHEGGKLLRPEQPGNVIARLALGAEKGLSGRFLR
jgi:NAD(P)-dependent dehydrogenase (short-subunit alcohol dehydrogenase family)